jgi:excisionase family DNA binding protein
MTLMTISEAAAALHVSVDTVRRRVRGGAIPATRDDKGQWWLRLTADGEPGSATDGIGVGVGTPWQANHDEEQLLRELRGQIADLRNRLDASEAERRADKAQAVVERERMLALIAQLTRP